MHICLYSSVFFPSVGGYQQVSATLAQGLHDAGHKVILVTPMPAPEQYDSRYPFTVVRADPSKIKWKQLLKGVDLVLSNGASLKPIFAWLRAKKPVVYIHGTYVRKETTIASTLS